jgi:hypothetical protein
MVIVDVFALLHGQKLSLQDLSIFITRAWKGIIRLDCLIVGREDKKDCTKK